MGALSPCSTTTLLWQRSWPFKPDVVAEGGNGSLDQGQPLVGPESLRLLTTHRDMARALLSETGDTSAAAAEAFQSGQARRWPSSYDLVHRVHRYLLYPA